MNRKILLALFLACAIAGRVQAAPAAGAVDFNREVRPILSDNCFTCHGPDEKQRMVKLRLDTREGAFADRGGYQVIVPGNAKESRLYQRIAAEKKALRMPPPASGRALTDKQIELIRKWIDAGAKWEEHWAYAAPQHPAPPEVQNKNWPRNPIDHFVLGRLEREGLKPSPEADRVTLLRRLSFDLTGLPPTPAEVDGFLKDRSKNAYEKQVERLLVSPRYGERMAMMWLDVARYADTHGYHIDSHRDMWPWRDWVIRAFNRNMPFDQFTIEQLAGDLLPNPGKEQLIATGFNRNHMINFEGGAIPEEYQAEYVADRVETTSIAWLGMTMQCARCHDHKYDPIKQKEFYQFAAFYNTIDEKGLDGRYGNAEPLLQLPAPEQEKRQKELQDAICERECALSESKIARLQAAWEKAKLEQLPEAPREALAAHYELDGTLADTSGRYLHGKALRGEVVYGGGQVARGADFSGETHVAMPGGAADFDTHDPFTLSVWVRFSGIREMPVLVKAGEGGRGFEIRVGESWHVGDLKRGALLSASLIHQWPDARLEIRTKEPLLQEQWHHVTITHDGSGRASGFKLWVNGTPRDVEVVADALAGTIWSDAPVEIGNKAHGNPYKGGLDDLRIYRCVLAASEIENLAIHWPIRTILDAPGKRTKDQKDRVREYFLTYDAPSPLREWHSELKAFRKELAELNKAIPSTMVMREMLVKPRETHVLGRGDYRNKGEKVEPGVPAVLPPLPGDAPRNRLGLAKWLVDPAHPLTARVAVNRFWQMYFGAGLVKTAENFGSQGDPPSHPELLDWLATEFVQTGWDVKGLQRLIVTSATYRQASKSTPELRERDPENRLLARGPRFRLPAETVRDNALFVSGLMNPEMYGPAAFPYQPKGIWEDIAYGDVYSAQTYVQSHGKDLYRRSMYTFWKRTAPPASLATFDAPDREKCTARRPLTNTPLQALVLMNDPTYVEAARALAARAMREAGGDPARRVRHLFRLVTGRSPVPSEMKVLLGLAGEQIAHYRTKKDDAVKLLKTGESAYDGKLDAAELAAWTTVASTVLNLDEAITKE